MKTLLIFRHAKAQPDAPHGDKARALTGRGKRNAASMGERLPLIAPAIDLVVSSDARRARQTAEVATTAARYMGEIVLQGEIYGAYVDTLIHIVRALPDSADCVLLVGHNPGFEDLSAALAEAGTPPPHLPTSGLAHLEFAASRWRDVREGKGRLVNVHTPKELGE
jgi:phosphohistidine phosphatase